MTAKNLFLLFLCFASAPALAVEMEYAKAFDVNGNVKSVGAQGQWQPIPENALLNSGSRLRTGEKSSVQVQFNRDLTSVLKVSPNTYVKFLNNPPTEIFLEKGNLYVVREDDEASAPARAALRIRTKDLLIDVKEGGCIVSVTREGTRLEVFQEKVLATHVLRQGGRSQAWNVREGYQLLAKSTEKRTTMTRMDYSNYEFWRAWMQQWYKHKDKIVREKIKKEVTL